MIKKSGIPVAKIVSFEKNKKDNLMDFAGMLTEKEANKLLKKVKTGRNDGSKFKNKLI